MDLVRKISPLADISLYMEHRVMMDHNYCLPSTISANAIAEEIQKGQGNQEQISSIMEPSDTLRNGDPAKCKRCKSIAQSGLKCVKCGTVSHFGCVPYLKWIKIIDGERINCCDENPNTDQVDNEDEQILTAFKSAESPYASVTDDQSHKTGKRNTYLLDCKRRSRAGKRIMQLYGNELAQQFLQNVHSYFKKYHPQLTAVQETAKALQISDFSVRQYKDGPIMSAARRRAKYLRVLAKAKALKAGMDYSPPKCSPCEDVLSDSVIKTESEWEQFEIDHIAGNDVSQEEDKPEFVQFKRRKMSRENEIAGTALNGSRDVGPEFIDVPVKTEIITENRIEPVIFFNECKSKTDEDLEDNDFEENDISISLDRTNKGGKKVYKIYTCNLCPYQSTRNHYFKKHMERHNNSKGIKMFKCDTCDFQSIYRTSLIRHQHRFKNHKEGNTQLYHKELNFL